MRLARWYRPLSSTNALQRITHVFGGQCRQLDFRDGKDILTAFLQSHRRRSDLDLESSIAHMYFEGLAGLKVECLPQRLRHDYSSSPIYGSSHGINLPYKWYFRTQHA